MAKFSTVHDADDHTGITNLFDAASADHDAHDHTGVPGVGGGGGIVSKAKVTRTAGDLSLTGGVTTKTEVSSALRLTVAASSGDLLLIGFNGAANGGNTTDLIIDSATIVSGSIVNHVTSGTRGIGHGYVGGTAWVSISGTLYYVVQAGDISGGNVTVSPTYMNSHASAGNLQADATYALQYWVVNLGQ